MKSAGWVLVFVLALGAVVWAQSDSDLDALMKSNNATARSLNMDLGAKNADAAATDAKTLVDNLTKVAAYWQAKNVDDAVKFATDAKASFSQVADLIAAGKLDDAQAAVRAAQMNCNGCHQAHRVRNADGTFSIK
jgi:hypothetical protein